MNLATYAARNLTRRKGRTVLTVLAVAIAVVIFCLIRSVVVAWNAGADAAAADRLATVHKVAIVNPLPRTYIDQVRALGPDVKAATWANWFGSKDPKKRTEFFAGFAADHETWFDVMDDMKVEPAVLEEWKKTPDGAILGDVLARTLQVKPGDKLMLQSDIFPGDWEFKVVGLYQPARKTADRNTLVFRWDYLNKDPRASFTAEKIGWMLTKVAPGASSPEVGKRIDALFEGNDDQTQTQSERAFQLGFLGAFAAILKALDLVSIVILLIMTLILANTISMNVRERTHEFGVLRAIGFSPKHVGGFILGESMLLALVGGLLGVGLSMLLINGAVGPVLEENVPAYFPYFSAPPAVLLLALALAAALGALAAAFPSVRTSKLRVIDALRRID